MLKAWQVHHVSSAINNLFSTGLTMTHETYLSRTASQESFRQWCVDISIKNALLAPVPILGSLRILLLVQIIHSDGASISDFPSFINPAVPLSCSTETMRGSASNPAFKAGLSFSTAVVVFCHVRLSTQDLLDCTLPKRRPDVWNSALERYGFDPVSAREKPEI